ncbi:MAG TPA: RNA polymerase factor sigma-54 [Burkholderiales bacterium]|nr:RNA polymerase factor sigma-54 [Burkholderiales bacterium]
MKPTLQFRLSQHLTLTPQLQQSIRLLQLSTVELNQEIERILMENPILERDEADGESAAMPGSPDAQAPAAQAPAEGAAGDAAPDGGAGTADAWSGEPATSWRSNDDEDSDRSFSAPDLPTLRDHLNTQLSLTNLGERDRTLVALLIDALDEDGYLTQNLEEIAALLPTEAEVELDELAIALRHLQNFDPSGVGARSPRECLALQIRARSEAGAAQLPAEGVRKLALAIVEHHLELLAKRDLGRLKSATRASDEALRAAQQFIRSLNPRPGAEFARVETRYVVPDVVVRKVRNVWRASLNPEAMPRLRINRLYAELTAGTRGGNALSTQLQEARWLIKNVQQRFETILRVSQAIVDQQRHFLEHGEVAMRPLVLREIAETLSLHESTISRVTTQKFMATPRGTFELKYFFGSHVSTDTGGAASSTAIRALIKQLVAEEDARAPLSDGRISQILGEQGIVVARRTIAKYRESLHIPPVSQRKGL